MYSEQKNTPEILKLRVLLCFLNESEKRCTVTGLAEILEEGKQRISRTLISLEKEGLIDRSNLRQPKLTYTGRKAASYYEERSDIVLNHMLYEGVDIDSAEYDSYVLAMFCSENGMKVFRESEQRYRAKYELRREKAFDGTVLCSYFGDGEYSFPFLIYREQICDGKLISMANEGFEHPCSLIVKKGIGHIRLKAVNISAVSPYNGKKLTGIVRNLRFFEDGVFKSAYEEGGYWLFPARVINFLNIGSGIGQILHGSVRLKMECSVGTAHMPESDAVFTVLI